MSSAPIPWKHVRNVLVLFAPLWVGATLIFGVAGLCYAVFRTDVYSARQPLVVRDEANGAVERLGRFPSQTELKAAQETILEMTQNPEVVRSALKAIGPPTRSAAKDWPTREVLDETIQSQVNLVAPKGSDFGNTEVVYLQVKDVTRERAKLFCNALFDSLTKRLRDVRRVRADSIIAELYLARDLAKENLEEAAVRMREIEVEFGQDLGELRNLNDNITGEGATRKSLSLAVAELQKAEQELTALRGLYELLETGAKDPSKMLISGSDLLTSQPSLLRLKDGLIAAQLKTSALSGHFTESNPKRRAALAAENRIREQLQQETEGVLKGMVPRIELAERNIARLTKKREDLETRLDRLAVARTDYSKMDAELKSRTKLLADAEKALTDAKASRSAAISTNLVVELGPPEVTDKPIGPPGSLLAMGASMAGLIFGLGAVFLIAPGPTQSHGRRRWSDYLSGQGRRASDAAAVERRAETDPTADQPQQDRREI